MELFSSRVVTPALLKAYKKTGYDVSWFLLDRLAKIFANSAPLPVKLKRYITAYFVVIRDL